MTPIFLKTALLSAAILIGQFSSVHGAAAENIAELAKTRRMTFTPQVVLAEVRKMKNPACDVAFLETSKGQVAIRETIDDYNKEAINNTYHREGVNMSKDFHATTIVNPNSTYNMWRVALIAARKKICEPYLALQ